MMNKKTYSELKELDTYEERFEYLKLGGKVGEDTFGFDRYLNQKIYKSAEWRKVRNEVIVRDRGCDMGVAGNEIGGTVYVHHMNPITKNDILHRTDNLLNSDYLITVSHETHNAIHYGDSNYTNRNVVIERTPNDTSPWKK